MARSEENLPPVRSYFYAWIAIKLVLGLSWGTAYLALGIFNFWINIGCAFLMTALIAIFFMDLCQAPPLLRLAALVGFFWLMFLYVLTLADVLTRGLFRAF